MITVTCHDCVLQWRFPDMDSAGEFAGRHRSLQGHHLTAEPKEPHAQT